MRKHTCTSYIYGFILSNSLLFVYTTRLLYTQICCISKGLVVEEINYYITLVHDIIWNTAKVGAKHKCNTNSSKPIQANQNNRQQISKIEINIMQTECISITLLSEGILERRINSDTTTRTVQVQR